MPRYDDLVRWSRFFDATLLEATASETIGRWVTAQPERPPGPRPLVRIVSAIHDVRSMLADVCLSAGYLVERLDDHTLLPINSLAICDSPVLEPLWAERLASRTQASRVISLLGFADRSNVSRAREAGAAACLDWPCDLDDLIHVLDRVAGMPERVPRLGEPAHVLPPSPHGLIRHIRPSPHEKPSRF